MPQVNQPLIAVTMGDPAGIGPEVIVRAWADAQRNATARLMVVGHSEVMRRAVRLLKLDYEVTGIDSLRNLPGDSAPANAMYCLDVCQDDSLNAPIGKVDPRSGEAAYQAVTTAARMAIQGEIDAIVTAPLNKAALHAAGHHYPGHTELLAEICGVSEFAMMLYLSRERGARSEEQAKTLRGDANVSNSISPAPSSQLPASLSLGVVHVTLHQSLRSVFDDITVPAIVSKCRLVEGVMRRLGVAQPRLAVCALNPHAGEDGLFGDEERTIIGPAVAEARRNGLDAAGPFPTDTLMARAAGGEFDAVVAMYHDQGHIAVKLIGMHQAVNITLGLPIIRTSVAHGTAFDRAWQGTARADGMMAAIETAARLAAAR